MNLGNSYAFPSFVSEAPQGASSCTEVMLKIVLLTHLRAPKCIEGKGNNWDRYNSVCSSAGGSL